jgi:chromosome segregation ATPase
MSEDMSVFKKMKDKITDEVNSATNKLQNIQIIDQLTTSIGQQIVKNDAMPHQKLPELPEHSNLPANNRFSLIDDNPIGDCGDDEELNSEVSPQHQLFNERFIRRLNKSPSGSKSSKHKNGSSPNSSHVIEEDNQHPVIDINHLSSDLEDDFGEIPANEDGEIDLLADKRVSRKNTPDDKLSSNLLDIYKTRYRVVVHALRRLNDDHRLDRFQLETETRKLTDQISVLKDELHDVKQQLQSSNSSTTSKENERKADSSNSQQSGKQTNKIKDLENLMAKCKESLKSKNAQLKILRNSLNEVDKFKEQMDDLKRELKELRNAHETWTLSIAENKRVMHQEIEEKNAEMDIMRSQLKESNNRLLQHKSNIQNLESQLISMSAAHQHERESLTKDLTNAKSVAIKRLQREHELQLERVKLDLEKSIESLKSEVLIRDEQIIRGGQKQQELEKQNSALTTDLEIYKKRYEDCLSNLEELKSERGRHVEELDHLKSQIEASKNHSTDCADLRSENESLKQRSIELEQQIPDLTNEISRLKAMNEHLNQQLDTLKLDIEQKGQQPCSSCQESHEEVEKLKIENQALKHDQKAYDDRIAILEADNQSLKLKIHEIDSNKSQMVEVSTSTTDEKAEESIGENSEAELLKKLIAENQQSLGTSRVADGADTPNSTEFEYLKNIVYQFLMGREPITLARVISAIFKFDKDQIEQICKIQEAIHHA